MVARACGLWAFSAHGLVCSTAPIGEIGGFRVARFVDHDILVDQHPANDDARADLVLNERGDAARHRTAAVPIRDGECSTRRAAVTVHELAHSVHLRSARSAALTAAVAGAPAVRAGSPWDDSEKVADCVAWVLYPAATAASGLTYWTCPDPWREQVRAALG